MAPPDKRYQSVKEIAADLNNQLITAELAIAATQTCWESAKNHIDPIKRAQFIDMSVQLIKNIAVHPNPRLQELLHAIFAGIEDQFDELNLAGVEVKDKFNKLNPNQIFRHDYASLLLTIRANNLSYQLPQPYDMTNIDKITTSWMTFFDEQGLVDFHKQNYATTYLILAKICRGIADDELLSMDFIVGKSGAKVHLAAEDFAKCHGMKWGYNATNRGRISIELRYLADQDVNWPPKWLNVKQPSGDDSGDVELDEQDFDTDLDDRDEHPPLSPANHLTQSTRRGTSWAAIAAKAPDVSADNTESVERNKRPFIPRGVVTYSQPKTRSISDAKPPPSEEWEKGNHQPGVVDLSGRVDPRLYGRQKTEKKDVPHRHRSHSKNNDGKTASDLRAKKAGSLFPQNPNVAWVWLLFPVVSLLLLAKYLSRFSFERQVVFQTHDKMTFVSSVPIYQKRSPFPEHFHRAVATYETSTWPDYLPIVNITKPYSIEIKFSKQAGILPELSLVMADNCQIDLSACRRKLVIQNYPSRVVDEEHHQAVEVLLSQLLKISKYQTIISAKFWDCVYRYPQLLNSVAEYHWLDRDCQPISTKQQLANSIQQDLIDLDTYFPDPQIVPALIHCIYVINIGDIFKGINFHEESFQRAILYLYQIYHCLPPKFVAYRQLFKHTKALLESALAAPGSPASQLQPEFSSQLNQLRI